MYVLSNGIDHLLGNIKRNKLKIAQKNGMKHKKMPFWAPISNPKKSNFFDRIRQ